MNRGKRIIAIVALVLVGATGLACGGTSGPSSSGKPVTEGSATGAPAATKAAAKMPAAKDFKITLKVLTKDCFGTAGCNITYRVNSVTVPPGLDTSKTYEVSYKVTGAEDPKEGTVTITNGKFDTESIFDEMASTKNKNAKLIATPTAVEIV